MCTVTVVEAEQRPSRATTRKRRGLTWEEMEAVNRAGRRADGQRTPEERLERGFQLSEFAMRLAEAPKTRRGGS